MARDLHTDFDFEDTAFATDFEAVLDDLVANCPVAHSQVGNGYYAFNRYADVRRCGQDWRTFSSADGWMLNALEGNIMILPEDSDPPYHTAWRSVLNPFFTARTVAPLEDAARVYTRELIENFYPSGSCEYVADFAAQLPGLVLFQHILPVPVADLPALFADINTYSFGALDERAPAFGRVHAYLEQFLAQRASEKPRGDLVDVMLAGVDKDGSPCPPQDKVNIALDIVFGGLATTTHAMSGGIYELAAHPALRRDLLRHPEQIDTAVEETVRLYAPVVAVGRTVTQDVEVAGVKLKAGQRIALNFAAASRDPQACEHPAQFDIRRPEVVHTAFGIGPHRCIGEHLARLEIKVAIQEFLAQIPEFGLQPGTQPRYESGQLRTMTELQLRWDVA
jgi:cytochrome P450